MAAARKNVQGSKGGTKSVMVATGRVSSSPAQARLMNKRMKGRR